MTILQRFLQQNDNESKLRNLLGKPRGSIKDHLTKVLLLNKSGHTCYDFTYLLDKFQLNIELKVQKDLQWLDPIKLYCTCKYCEDDTIYLFVCIDNQNHVDMILMIIQSTLRKVLEAWSEVPWGLTLADFISKSCALFGSEGKLSKVQVKCPLYIRELKDYLISSQFDSNYREWIIYAPNQ